MKQALTNGGSIPHSPLSSRQYRKYGWYEKNQIYLNRYTYRNVKRWVKLRHYLIDETKRVPLVIL